MPSWLQGLLSNPRIWAGVLFFVFVLGSSIVKQVKDAKVKREAKQRAMQEEMDRIRTGGVQPTPLSPPHRPMIAPPAAAPASPRQASLEEIAESRRRKIEELRRRQQGGSSQASASSPAGTRTVRLPNGIAIEVPSGNQPAPVPPPVPPRAPAQPQRPQPPRRPSPKPPRLPVTEPVRSQEPAALAPAYEVPPPPASPMNAPPRSAQRPRSDGLAAMLRAGDPAAVRRAIVMSELLGPPMSARP